MKVSHQFTRYFYSRNQILVVDSLSILLDALAKNMIWLILSLARLTFSSLCLTIQVATARLLKSCFLMTEFMS